MYELIIIEIIEIIEIWHVSVSIDFSYIKTSTNFKYEKWTSIDTVAPATRLCTLAFARHTHEHTPALALVVRKSVDYKVNKENGELYFKIVNSNYNSHSLWTLSRLNQKNILLHRTSLLTPRSAFLCWKRCSVTILLSGNFGNIQWQHRSFDFCHLFAVRFW